MIQIGNNTKLSPRQLRLTELFSVERILSSRGFQVLREGTGIDTIIPRTLWTTEEADLVFAVLSDPVMRSELLGLINGLAGAVYQEKVIGVRSISGVNMTRDAFSRTFEWFVGEMLVRRFGAFSSSYGVNVAQIVRNSDGGTSGDFDVLSVLGTMELLYVECKTGGFSQSKILNMVERARSLHASASVMFVSSLNIPSLKQQLSGVVYPGHAVEVGLRKARIKSITDSEVFFWADTYFVSADETTLNVEPKIRAVLRLMECKKAELDRGVGVSEEDYQAAGYEVTIL